MRLPQRNTRKSSKKPAPTHTPAPRSAAPAHVPTVAPQPAVSATGEKLKHLEAKLHKLEGHISTLAAQAEVPAPIAVKVQEPVQSKPVMPAPKPSPESVKPEPKSNPVQIQTKQEPIQTQAKQPNPLVTKLLLGGLAVSMLLNAILLIKAF